MRALVVTCTLIFVLGFSIRIADANQHLLIDVQWQQLGIQNHALSVEEKLNKIQAMTSLIDLQPSASTSVTKTPNEIFGAGVATEAELAFAKWMMLKELGIPAEEFRLVYVNDTKSNESHVWLAWYQNDQTTIITSSDILNAKSQQLGLASNVDVLAVLDPQQVLQSRQFTRTASVNSKGAVFI